MRLGFIPNHIRTVFKVYLLGIVFFTIFRIINFVLQYDKLELIPNDEFLSIVFQSFLMGLRFDTVISGYILAVPFLMLLLNEYLLKTQTVSIIVKFFLLILYGIAFLISAFDIPFFDYFFDRMNVSVFLWIENVDFAITMVFQEWKYIWPLIPLVFFVILFSKVLKNIFSKVDTVGVSPKPNLLIVIGINIVFAVGLFYGIRGRFETKSPIRIGTAYFSSYPFPNKLALNPVFTLLKSYLNSLKPEYKDIKLMEDTLALTNSKMYLNIKNGASNTLERKLTKVDSLLTLNYNVVLVVMESMTSAKMNYFNKEKNLTPTLDSLAHHSYFFNNIYSSGIHTFNGIHSTLYSFPAVFRKQPLNTVPIDRYYGLPSVLKKNGYHNMYFTTHDEQFDNVGGFLLANDFDEIISAKDYPEDKLMSTLGVTDDYLFQNGIVKMNKEAKKGRFFAAFMTSSDHGPYYVPPEFNSAYTDVKEKAVNYADWSIGQFLNEAKNQSWYDSTLFVFIADHGQAMNVTYDMPINYNHVPLFIFAKGLESDYKVVNEIGGQIDLYPTIMGLLNYSYTNTTFGIDLLKEKRPFMYFNGDNKFGVINNDHYYIWRQSGIESLYKFKEKSLVDYKDSLPELTKEMSDYGKSFIQTAQYLQKNRLTDVSAKH
jgi:phosphoglycerol transferase MdoB-like AlkP superfamily enzyme